MSNVLDSVDLDKNQGLAPDTRQDRQKAKWVIECLQYGLTWKQACAYAGMEYETVRQWTKRYPLFKGFCIHARVFYLLESNKEVVKRLLDVDSTAREVLQSARYIHENWAKDEIDSQASAADTLRTLLGDNPDDEDEEEEEWDC